MIIGSVAAAAGYAIGKFLPKSSGDKLYLRPPGAVDDFDDLCVKCGQCVQVCPYHSISLLDIEDGYSNGSAHIDAKERGCYLCDLFPCVLSCPSGALDHATKVVGDVKMGVAVLSDTAACLSVKRENLSENGFMFQNDIFSLPKNIGFDQNYLILLYNPYEIAPYSTGILEVKIPLSEVNHWLSFNLNDPKRK